MNLQEYAKWADERDPLRSCRDEFFYPHGKIYFCGNSLGLQPKKVRRRIDEILDDWARLGVEGHVSGERAWKPYHERLTAPLARLVGAKEREVVAMNALTVNLHLLLTTFYRPTRQRYRVVMEDRPFPSDRYAVASHARMHGFDDAIIHWPRRSPHEPLRIEDLLELLEEKGSEIAMLLIGGVNYYDGQKYDIPTITDAGRRVGCVVGWDLAHAIGNIELKLHEWNVDFAVWCSYKYLNGGPGAVAGVFIHENRLRDENLPRAEGWWGHDKKTRFKMPPDFVPIRDDENVPTAEAWQLSNPPILSMAALEPSLELFDQTGMPALLEKQRSLGELMEKALKDIPNIAVITPPERGCQFSIAVRDFKIFEKLWAAGVVCDWREPDVIRVAPVPFYNTHSEIVEFAKILKASSA
ncbi:MAG: kynureninase [Bacteroidia bacterium]|nr:kynureninase [Bacteroidia bacterium]MDW8334521.1 kynureninase [Bacteroidia bacterium]